MNEKHIQSDYTIFTAPGCGLCENIKKFFADNDTPYKEIVIGRDMLRDEVKRKFPYVRNLPVILVGPTQISFETAQSIVMMDKKGKLK